MKAVFGEYLQAWFYIVCWVAAVFAAAGGLVLTGWGLINLGEWVAENFGPGILFGVLFFLLTLYAGYDKMIENRKDRIRRGYQ